MKHSRTFVLVVFALAILAEIAPAQPPGCVTPGYQQAIAYYPAPVYYGAPVTTYYAAQTYSSYYSRAYSSSYTPPALVYGPAGVPYRTSSYTGYYPAFYPPANGSGYYTSSYGGAVVPSPSYYLPGTSYYTPSYSNTPGFNRVFLTTGDFHY